MRLQRGFTNKEWKEIGEKYKDGGVHMFRGKKTFFWNGEKLYYEDPEDEDREEEGVPRVYDTEERNTWEVIIVLPGVELIPRMTFINCKNLKFVIMADTVRRIEFAAFQQCSSLVFVKLSRSLEYLGDCAFAVCESLTSIFIPPSCRNIGDVVFSDCKRLIIFHVPQHTQLGWGVITHTALINASPFSEDGNYDFHHDEPVNQWIKSINNEDAYTLHRACSSFNPLSEIIHDLVKRQGIRAMRMKNAIGVTPSQYLEANMFTTISEKDIMKRFILDSMGEVF